MAVPSTAAYGRGCVKRRFRRQRRIKKTQANIDRYLAKLDAVDEEEPELREVTAEELKQKIASMEAKTNTSPVRSKGRYSKAEMSLHVLAYNMKRAIKVLGAEKIIKTLQPA
jgi:hypothetical protein